MAKIQFCERCGKMLKISEKNNRKMGNCSCGFEKEINSETNFAEKTKKIEKGEGVFENKEEKEGFPHRCKKCGHEQSDIHDLGAPYSDETNIYLFRCKKCGHVERQADGTGNL